MARPVRPPRPPLRLVSSASVPRRPPAPPLPRGSSAAGSQTPPPETIPGPGRARPPPLPPPPMARSVGPVPGRPRYPSSAPPGQAWPDSPSARVPGTPGALRGRTVPSGRGRGRHTWARGGPREAPPRQPPPPGTPDCLRTENPGPRGSPGAHCISSLISPVSSFPTDPFNFLRCQIFLLCRLPSLGSLPTILPSLTATSPGARLGNLFCHFITDALTQTFNFLGSAFLSVQWRYSNYLQVAMRIAYDNEGKMPSVVPGITQVPLQWSQEEKGAGAAPSCPWMGHQRPQLPGPRP